MSKPTLKYLVLASDVHQRIKILSLLLTGLCISVREYRIVHSLQPGSGKSFLIAVIQVCKKQLSTKTHGTGQVCLIRMS